MKTRENEIKIQVDIDRTRTRTSKMPWFSLPKLEYFIWFSKAQRWISLKNNFLSVLIFLLFSSSRPSVIGWKQTNSLQLLDQSDRNQQNQHSPFPCHWVHVFDCISKLSELSEVSRHFLVQSEVKPRLSSPEPLLLLVIERDFKTSSTGDVNGSRLKHTLFPAFCAHAWQLYPLVRVLAGWVTGVSFSFVAGHCNYFGFRFFYQHTFENCFIYYYVIVLV